LLYTGNVRTLQAVMRRWYVWLPLSLAVLLAVAAAGAYLARAELAEAGLKHVLARQGLERTQLTVTTLSHRQLEVTDLELGDGGPRVARLAVRYTPSGLLDGVVERVEIDGPRLSIDLTRDAPLGPLGKLLGRAQEDGTDGTARAGPPALPERLPTVVLRNADVQVLSDRGRVDLTLDGRLGPQDGDLAAFLRGSARAPHTTADLIVSADRLRQDPRLSVEMTGETDLARAPWPAGAPVTPTRGRAAFSVDGELAMPALGARLTPASLLDRDGALAVDLTLSDTALAAAGTPLAAGLEGGLALRAEAAAGRLLLRLDDPARWTLDTLHAAGIEALGIPETTAAELAELRQLSLSPWTGGGELVELAPSDREGGWQLQARGSALAVGDPARVRLSGQVDAALDPGFGLRRVAGEPLRLELDGVSYGAHALGRGRFEGRLLAKPGGLSLDGTLDASDLTLAAGGNSIRQVSLQAPLALRVTDAGTRLTLSDDGRIVLPELPATGAIRPQMPLRLRVSALELTQLDQGLQLGATVDPGRLTATLLRQDAPNLSVSATPGPMELELSRTDAGLVAEGRLRGARIEVADLQVAARGLDADISYGTDRPLADVRVARIADVSGTPAFAPARLDMTIQKNDQLWAAAGAIRPLETEAEIPFWLDHRVDTGEGGVELGPATLTFAPDGLQPADLSPLLAPHVDRAEGAVTLAGRLQWTDAGLSSFGDAELSDVAVTTPQVQIEGLSGTLRFDRLLPPQTEPRQTLTADRVTAGVPLDDVRLRFDLDWPPSGPVLGVMLAEGHLAGGRIYVERAQLTPLAARNAATVRVEGLSMRKLVAQLDLEGVEADGTLEGEIPVALGASGVEIDQGRLLAVETGSILVDLGETSDALASRGEQVALMVKALKDFQYDELSLSLNRPPDGGMEIGITMQGKNPDVLDGYPFRFNITLTGDLAPIVAALQEGRRLTSDLLDRALDAAR
jgi:hypothetical protein